MFNIVPTTGAKTCLSRLGKNAESAEKRAISDVSSIVVVLIYFSQNPGHGKGWVRLMLLHDPAVGWGDIMFE